MGSVVVGGNTNSIANKANSYDVIVGGKVGVVKIRRVEWVKRMTMNSFDADGNDHRRVQHGERSAGWVVLLAGCRRAGGEGLAHGVSVESRQRCG